MTDSHVTAGYRRRAVLALACILGLLGACGQSGPLVLPQRATPGATSQTAASSQPADDSEDPDDDERE